MNYQNHELLEQLAAQYVLGTLRGPARRRFERLVEASTAALAATLRWENNLAGLTRALTPVQPSARVWRGLQSRLAATDGVRAPFQLRRRAWQFGLAAGLIAVALVVGLLVREQRVALQPVAALGADASHPVWQIERRNEYSALRIRVVGVVERRAGRSYELWALPKGGAPVSLGLLPERGSLERTLSATQRAALLASEKIAVSVEPELGSPTGSPTGPVIIIRDVTRTG
jgi:anti-sigma-K factor RskA